MKRNFFLMAWGFAIGVLLAGLELKGQSVNPGEPVVVFPGNPVFNLKNIKAETAEFEVYAISQGERADMGVYRHQLTPDRKHGTVLRVQEIHLGGVHMVDSSIAKLKDLSPVYHASHHPGRHMYLRWSKHQVDGLYEANNGSREEIHYAFEDASFDAGMHDIALRYLPFAKDYSALMAVYDYDAGGLRWYKIEGVTENEWRGKPVWVVPVYTGEVKNIFWIDQASRQIQRIETQPNFKYSVFMDRK